MSHSGDRFDVAVDQVKRFLDRIPSVRRRFLDYGFPRKLEHLAVNAIGSVPLRVEYLPRLSERIAARAMWAYGHRPRWEDDDELMGYIAPHEDVVVIFVSQAFPHPTQRFTLAHEIGHLARDVLPRLQRASQLKLETSVADQILAGLRRDVPGMVPMDEGGPRPPLDLQEYYANLFAAELLMPRAEVRRRVNMKDPADARVARVMRDFDVSRAAARVRLQMLGLMEGRDDAMELFDAPPDARA